MHNNPYSPPIANLNEPTPSHPILAQWNLETALTAGWEAFKNNAGLVLAAFLICGTIVAIPSIISILIDYMASLSHNENLNILWVFMDVSISIISFFVTAYFNIGWMKFNLNIMKNHTADPRRAQSVEAKLNNLFETDAPIILSAFLANFLIAVGIVLGLIALIVPGVILSIAWSFVFYIIIDRKMGAIEAMRMSWRITRGHKTYIFVFYLVCVLLGIFGMLLTCGLGLLVLSPVMTLATTYIYLCLLSSSAP